MRGIVAVAGALALAASLFSSVAFARDPVPVGTYTIVDLGQGGHGSGPLYSDGTIGGGHFSYDDGQNVGTITGTTWSPAGPDAVTLCFTDSATRGQLLFPSPSCITLPTTGDPMILSLAPGPETLLRVTMN